MSKPQVWKQISFYLYAAGVCLVFFICLLFGAANYSRKQDFPLPNWLSLIIGLAVIGLIGFLIKKATDTKFYQKHEIIIISLLSVFSLAYSLFAAYSYQFVTGWDAGDVIINAHRIASHITPNELYYSTCPNNLS